MPFPLLVAIVVTAVRVAAPIVIRQVVRQGARQATRTVARTAVRQTSRSAARVARQGAKRGNTRLNRYRDKAMEKLSKACRKAVDKFGGHIHGRKSDVITPGSGRESNHILQNALFEATRGDGSSICSGYKASRAPAIPLSTKRHKSISDRQRKWADGHLRAGTQPTYDEARREARNQTRMAGASRKEAECIMKFVDQVMEQLCPDLVDPSGSNPGRLRTPGSRSPGRTGTDIEF